MYRSLETPTAHGDVPQIGKIDAPVATDDQRVAALGVADQLHLDAVARADHVLGRYWHIGGWGEGGRLAAEQIVAERLQRIGANRLERQTRDAHDEVLQARLGGQALGRFLGGGPPEWNRPELGHVENAPLVQFVRVPPQHSFAKLAEATELFAGALESALLLGRGGRG